MDSNWIIGGGIGLGVLLLLLGGRKQSGGTSDAGNIAAASLNASAAQAASAPALLDSLTQLQQVQLASANAHESNVYGFLSGIDSGNITRMQNFLAVGAHSQDLAANDKINAREVSAQKRIALEQIAAADRANKRASSNDFFGKIFSTVQGLSGQATGVAQTAIGAGASLGSSSIGQLGNLFSGGGAASGATLSQTGGGVGGGSGSGGGNDLFGSLIKIIPAIAAFL